MADLDDLLVALRPEPELRFVRDLEASLLRPQRNRPRLRARALVAGCATVALCAGLAATGGLSYAASSLAGAAHVAKRVHLQSAGGDQYRPGYGFGDPNHNHD